MCLIALMHSGDRLVLAANRDEEYSRPTRSAHAWHDAPDVIGGRDLSHGGSWLAITRSGRFAAVTNLRNGGPGSAEGGGAPLLSRGFLVRDFVLGDDAPLDYARAVASRARDYNGFHLIAGVAGGEVAHYTNGAGEPTLVGEIFAISNGPLGEEWPKVAMAREVISNARDVHDLLEFLSTRTHGGSSTIETIPSDVFVVSDRYGTRASTVIVADSEGVKLYEQNFGPNGVAGELVRLEMHAPQP